MKEEVANIGRAELLIGQEAKGKFHNWNKILIAIVPMISPMRETGLKGVHPPAFISRNASRAKLIPSSFNRQYW